MELCRRSIRTQDFNNVNLLLFHTKGVIVFATIHSSIRLGIWKNKDNDHNISSLSRRLRTVSLFSVQFLNSFCCLFVLIGAYTTSGFTGHPHIDFTVFHVFFFKDFKAKVKLFAV